MSVGLLLLILVLACASSDEADGPAAQVADMSQFPTPTRSQAEPQPTSPPAVAQAQATQGVNAASGEQEPISEAEIQELRQRLQSGELTEEEARQAFQRLRAQFGEGRGGPGGSQIAGSIESIEESAFTVATDLASIPVSVGADTIFRVTSVLEPTALTDDAQVMVASERQEGKTLARAVTVIPEGQTQFRGRQGGLGGAQGAFGGNQAGPGGRGGLFGTVTGVNDGGFTLETQQGPLPIVMNEGTVVIETREGSFADLEVGMQVRVTGPAEETGSVDARSVTITPAGLEDLLRPGGASGVN